jgi:curved DNA-binding protein CbpA
MGIPRDSCADVVRTTFLQLAMRYHVDTSGKDTVNEFQRIRAAFDKITKSGGKENKNRTWLTEEVFNVWFEQHTGLRMDAATRREVMIAYRGGACKNGNTTTRYLLPACQIAFILEEEGLFIKKLACNKNAFSGPILPQLGSRRKRGF